MNIWPTAARVFISLRALLAAMFVTVLVLLLLAAIGGEGLASNAFVVTGVFLVVWAFVIVGRTGQEMERRGHSADPAQLALLGMGMGALALVAFAAFALTGSLSERSPSEIARQVTKTEQDRDVRCKVGGEDSLGDRIWKCGQTLTADGGTPKDIIGERITSCYGLTESRNLDSLTEQPCDRLDPATGGKPK